MTIVSWASPCLNMLVTGGADTLLRWSDRVLTAATLDAILAD
ncbi:hypothetical protein [Thiocapsa imhoffii]|nr:hypothetical protein [Thiocapsa imhoffii]